MALDPTSRHQRGRRGTPVDLAARRPDAPVVVSAKPEGSRWITQAGRAGSDIATDRHVATRGEAWSEAWRIAQALGPSILVLYAARGSVAGVWYVDGEGRSSAMAYQQFS
jgi:hypothetical protein